MKEGDVVRLLLIGYGCSCLLLSGCSTAGAVKERTSSRQAQQAPSPGPGPAVAAETGRQAVTSAVRHLPRTFRPGSGVEVRLSVSPSAFTSGVIVTETPPSGWKMLKADPVWTKRKDDSYQWLIYGETLSSLVIRYTVEPPAGVKGEQNFEGNVRTYGEGLIPTGGDTTTRPEK